MERNRSEARLGRLDRLASFAQASRGDLEEPAARPACAQRPAQPGLAGERVEQPVRQKKRLVRAAAGSKTRHFGVERGEPALVLAGDQSGEVDRRG